MEKYELAVSKALMDGNIFNFCKEISEKVSYPTPKLKQAHEESALFLEKQNMDYAIRTKNVSIDPETGALIPLVGFKPRQTEGMVNQAKFYLPHPQSPGANEYSKELAKALGEPQITASKELGRHERQSGAILSEIEEVSRKAMNESRAKIGLGPIPKNQAIYELDPIKQAAAKRIDHEIDLSKQEFIRDVINNKVALSKEEFFKTVPLDQRYKYRRFDAPADKMAIESYAKVEGRLHDKFFKNSDLDSILNTLNMKKPGLMEVADATANAINVATSFYRKAALYSPKYLMSNFAGNGVQSFLMAPNKQSLAMDMVTALKLMKN
jgi:hypothetical protein